MDKASYDREHYQRNKERKDTASAAWRKTNPTARARVRRRAWLKKAYGLTELEVAHMVVVQGGACAICRTEFMEYRNCHVDHNHDTGEVRGLLCSNCNPGLGQFKDDPARLRAAAVYLEGGVSS